VKGTTSTHSIALASLLSDGERFAEAEPLARRALELDRGSWQANAELARALIGLHRDADAEAPASTAAKEQPGNPNLRLILANVHMNAQNYTAGQTRRSAVNEDI
jgi:Flp pilus assembly protein TadD